MPGNCSLEISRKFTGAITQELKILRVPGTRGTRPNKDPDKQLQEMLVYILENQGDINHVVEHLTQFRAVVRTGATGAWHP